MHFEHIHPIHQTKWSFLEKNTLSLDNCHWHSSIYLHINGKVWRIDIEGYHLDLIVRKCLSKYVVKFVTEKNSGKNNEYLLGESITSGCCWWYIHGLIFVFETLRRKCRIECVCLENERSGTRERRMKSLVDFTLWEMLIFLYDFESVFLFWLAVLNMFASCCTHMAIRERTKRQ